MLFGKQKPLECRDCLHPLVAGGPVNSIDHKYPRVEIVGIPGLTCSACGLSRLSPETEQLAAQAVRDVRAVAQRLGGVTCIVVGPPPSQRPMDEREPAEPDMALYERLAHSENHERLDHLQLTAEVSERLDDFVHGIAARQRIQEAAGPRLRTDVERSVLNLWGPPGTGKTTIAKGLAHRLGRDLFILTAAALESSKVGETAKNIVRLFRAIRELDGVLLIDEADSLVDARTRATNGHEKALNQARNALINELNRFRGVVIFASNLRENYDTALARRMEEIHVPPPDRSQLRLILATYLGEMSLGPSVTEDWIASLEQRITRHEATYGDPLRPFTAADIRAVIERAARTASRKRPDAPKLTVQRREVDAALEQHCKQLAAIRKPSAEVVHREANQAASALIHALIESHSRRYAKAAQSRVKADAPEHQYRPMAEAMMSDGLSTTALLIDDLKRLRALLSVTRLQELPLHLDGFLRTASPHSVPNLV